MITPRDGAEQWTPNMPAPKHVDVEYWQRRINDIVGSRDGRPIIKLIWCPAEKRWTPHPHGMEPPGYTFPVFIAYTTAEGYLVSPPFWGLMVRLEPEQYAPTWEKTRYTVERDGRLWDWKGPIPTDKYEELKCHSYHDGVCCRCIGYECKCGVQYAHCWGRYADPNEHMLQWIGKKAREAYADPDVDPTRDVRAFEAPQAQREVAHTLITKEQKRKEDQIKFSNYMLSHWERKPVSTSGIILTDR